MIIGLTGGIGSGKSAAADFFIDLGIEVIDADELSKKALSKNSYGYTLFLKEFGQKYLNTDMEVNRESLRNEIFFDKSKKETLEKIIHPIVSNKILEFINNFKSPYCIVMVPLIFETNSSNNYDRVLVIDCDIETQIQRSSTRDKQTKKQIEQIILKQATRNQRLSIANDVILNNSSLSHLKNEVSKIHKKYMEISNNA